MNCEAVKEMLWAYLKQELTAEEAVKIEEHLKSCAKCRKERNLCKEMMETLAGLPEEELPEGYHAELMQKLKAEAAPHVVPFPQKAAKKKKRPMYKQWGMIAAAVLAVVAAGGMDGLMAMRDSQNAAMEQMKAADTAEPMETAADDAALYNGIADVAEDYLADMDALDITYQSGKQKSAAGASEESVTTQGGTRDAAEDGGAVPEVASEEEETPVQFSVTRSVERQDRGIAVLTVNDLAAAKAALQQAIAAVEGFEETAEAEDSVIAVIPGEAFEAFLAELEAIGEMNWQQKEDPAEGTPWRTIEIQLNRK